MQLHLHYMQKIHAYFNRHPFLRKVVCFIDLYLPLPVMVSFYSTFIYLILTWDKRAIAFVLIPALTYALISIVRMLVPQRRPFDTLNFTPLRSHAKSNSFPSRHASSTAVIGMALYYIYPPWGTVMIATSFIIALTRVFTGVHYPKDVVLGLAVGYIVGYVGFFMF